MFRFCGSEEKAKGNRQFKEKVSDTNGTAPRSGRSGESTLTAAQLEESKVRLMLQRRCSVWPVESADQLAAAILYLTKSVTERPFK